MISYSVESSNPQALASNLTSTHPASGTAQPPPRSSFSKEDAVSPISGIARTASISSQDPRGRESSVDALELYYPQKGNDRIDGAQSKSDRD